MREVEVKIAAESRAAVRRRILALGARQVRRRTFEDNRIYDDAQRSLRKRGRVLRVRSAGGIHTLTFKKKPDEPDSRRYKIRIEHETRIESPEQANRILADLGYQQTYRYQKYRETFRFRGVLIEIDETPIGVFLELEGAPAHIDRVAALLGHGPADYIRRNYRRLHEDHAGSSEPGDLVFPSRRRGAGR